MAIVMGLLKVTLRGPARIIIKAIVKGSISIMCEIISLFLFIIII